MQIEAEVLASILTKVGKIIDYSFMFNNGASMNCHMFFFRTQPIKGNEEFVFECDKYLVEQILIQGYKKTYGEEPCGQMVERIHQTKSTIASTMHRIHAGESPMSAFLTVSDDPREDAALPYMVRFSFAFILDQPPERPISIKCDLMRKIGTSESYEVINDIDEERKKLIVN